MDKGKNQQQILAVASQMLLYYFHSLLGRSWWGCGLWSGVWGSVCDFFAVKHLT